jgi:hypothetical protein
MCYSVSNTGAKHVHLLPLKTVPYTEVSSLCLTDIQKNKVIVNTITSVPPNESQCR